MNEKQPQLWQIKQQALQKLAAAVDNGEPWAIELATKLGQPLEIHLHFPKGDGGSQVPVFKFIHIPRKHNKNRDY